MKNFRLFILAGLFLFGTQLYGQHLPSSYEGLLDEVVDNFKEIRGGNSLNDGKESLRLLNDEKIIVRMEHRKKVKTLTFTKKSDEEGSLYWVAGNKLTTDMVNKYEKELSNVLEKMLDLSRKEAKKD